MFDLWRIQLFLSLSLSLHHWMSLFFFVVIFWMTFDSDRNLCLKIKKSILVSIWLIIDEIIKNMAPLRWLSLSLCLFESFGSKGLVFMFCLTLLRNPNCCLIWFHLRFHNFFFFSNAINTISFFFCSLRKVSLEILQNSIFFFLLTKATIFH